MASGLSFDTTIINHVKQGDNFILQTPAKPVSFPLGQNDLTLIKSLKEKLLELGGVGLAAPQINQSKQIIAIFIPTESARLRGETKGHPLHVLINPQYRGIESEPMIADFEVCYSVSHTSGKVSRYQHIHLTYFDEKGQRHESIEKGFYARVLQHEIDHIHGILIIDRLTKDCVQGSINDMMQLRYQSFTKEQQALYDSLHRKR